MSFKTEYIITCDGVGCDIEWRGQEQDLKNSGVHISKISMLSFRDGVPKTHEFFHGYLCMTCEAKYYNAFVKAVPND